jgi:L-Ala-D/L-Glu epimerase / N-acetyl-D-glutamate racemase
MTTQASKLIDAPPAETLMLYRYRLPLKTKFEHAAASRDASEGVLVVLRLADGTVGLGEGVPRPYVTGETVESALEIIQSQYAARLAALDPLAEGPLPGSALGVWHNAAWCACELAYLDAAARSAGQPLARFLSGRLSRPLAGRIHQRVSGVIGAERPSGVQRRLRLMRLFGLRDFKLKVGTDIDHTNLTVCQERLGSGLARGKFTLRVDANGVWTLGEALRACSWMAQMNVAALEQPLRKGDEADLPRLRAESDVPIMLDESLVACDAASRLAAAGAADYWNLRISKNGGLLASLRLADLARESGIGLMLGAMVGESGILASAARTFLQLVPEVRWVENAYGSFLLTCDLVRERTRFGYGGKLKPFDRPGLGVTLNETIVERQTEKVAEIRL